jgi:cellulose synthase/poly-beta-1,6-N-acetylglucosamine synthase-like glycosyltransferase
MNWLTAGGTAFLLGLVFLFVYPYLLYPIVLTVGAHLVSLDQSAESEPESLPSVTLIIAAYNEAPVIQDKIENTLALSYPESKLEIIVFSDGSTDETDEIVKQFPTDDVKLIRIEGRVGKTICQNRIAEVATGDVLVFSDANSMYEPDALDTLVAGFDESTGCVVGELRYEEGKGESIYWRFERLLKRLESKTGSTVAGNGAIYAVDAQLYEPLPADSVSDFEEPLTLLKKRYRVRYQPRAVAWEIPSDEITTELERRTRIVTRSLNSLSRQTALLNPLRHPEVSVKLWSHKLMRWASPFLLVVIFGLSVLLAFVGGTIGIVMLGLQLLGYTAATVGAIFDRYGKQPTVVYVPYYFLVSNYGMWRGIRNFCAGETVISWETVSREETE